MVDRIHRVRVADRLQWLDQLAIPATWVAGSTGQGVQQTTEIEATCVSVGDLAVVGDDSFGIAARHFESDHAGSLQCPDALDIAAQPLPYLVYPMF